MTDTLRDKLIQKGWVTPFNVDTLVRLIEDHYADEPAVPEGREPAAVIAEPSDEDVLKLAQQYSVAYVLGDGSACHPFQDGYDMRNDVLRFARAVLARWGNQPAPPADGEVAELVAWLRMQGEAQKPGPNSLFCDKTKNELHANGTKLLRAAELLQRQVLVPEVNND